MSREKLYALAALLWFVAGVNVLRIGLLGWPTEEHLLGSSLWAVGSLLFFAGFIFPRVVRRNLTSLTQRSEVALRWYHCFTPSSWIIMCVMITLGVTIRMLELAPPRSSQASTRVLGSRSSSPSTHTSERSSC